MFLFRQRGGFSLLYRGVQTGSAASQILFSGNGRINSTKSPASGASNVKERRLVSELGTVQSERCG